MTVAVRPICTVCRHYDRENDEALTCSAFPDGIPDPIIDSVVDHRQPVEGDHGIRFQPADAAATRYADEVFA